MSGLYAGRRKKGKAPNEHVSAESALFKLFAASFREHFCLCLKDLNLVTRVHLAAREAGKCSLSAGAIYKIKTKGLY